MKRWAKKVFLKLVTGFLSWQALGRPRWMSDSMLKGALRPLRKTKKLENHGARKEVTEMVDGWDSRSRYAW